MIAELKEEVHSLRNIITYEHRNMTLTNDYKRQTPEVVAFTAYLSYDPLHIANGQIIPFDRTVTNVGNAFNIHNHTFICPVDGLYMFSFVLTHLGIGEVLEKLVIDGARKGQAVQVINYFVNDVYYRSDEINRFLTFRGVLLQVM